MPSKKTKKEKEVSSEEELDDSGSDHKPKKGSTVSLYSITIDLILCAEIKSHKYRRPI